MGVSSIIRHMQTMVIPISEDILQAAQMDKDEMAAHMRREYAVKLYDVGTLTLTQAANLCGLDMFAFLAVLAKAGVPVANYGEEELERELV